jgi:hypothetical protein
MSCFLKKHGTASSSMHSSKYSSKCPLFKKKKVQNRTTRCSNVKDTLYLQVFVVYVLLQCNFKTTQNHTFLTRHIVTVQWIETKLDVCVTLLLYNKIMSFQSSVKDCYTTYTPPFVGAFTDHWKVSYSARASVHPVCQNIRSMT